jgi:hypothetical protein
MPRKLDIKDPDGIMKELEGDNDRAAILVGASIVENALGRCIRSRLREPSTDEERQALFSENGILGTFSELIWMAYFMRLIGPLARRNLDLIRLIRNHAAHDMNPLSFSETSEIYNRCRELDWGLPFAFTKAPSPRMSFILSVTLAHTALSSRASDHDARFKGLADVFEKQMSR